MVHRLVTVERHLMDQERLFPEATGEFSSLMSDIAIAGKVVSREVNKAGLVEILGLTGYENVQGESVQKLDEYADQVFVQSLIRSGHICIMATEEREYAVHVPEGFKIGKYALTVDPLDGSSNIDANVSIGTIFGIHRKISPGIDGSEEDYLQPGWKLAAAGYIIYGSSTMMVYTTGNGVHAFTLDPSIGEFLLCNEDVKMPVKGRIYSCNEGNYRFWSEGTKKYIDYLKEMDPASDRPYTARYIGSLVADFHRNLLFGGIFLYPVDKKNPRKPRGKLRLLYEAQPLAMIAVEAGGAAIDGLVDILDIVPEELHQRVPLIIGSKYDVELYRSFIKKYDT
ncbi:class 1 fructose-bisphosphatase [bacterium]|nr:class 1 fructose-bisphosphatase [bacterium]